MRYNETVKRTRAAKEGAGMDCHTFCRLSCMSVSAFILGLYLHLHAFVVVLSLPQFCRYIVVYVVLFCSVFCIYCVCYSNSRLVEYVSRLFSFSFSVVAIKTTTRQIESHTTLCWIPSLLVCYGGKFFTGCAVGLASDGCYRQH